MSSLNNNLSECITLGDSSLACQTRVSFGRCGLACIQGDQTCVSLHLPAPRGGERKKHEQQNLHSTHSGRSGMQRFQSSYLCLRKVSKNPVSTGCAPQPLSLTPAHRLIKEQTNVIQYYFPPRGDPFSNTRV